jgi:hypothetical protein
VVEFYLKSSKKSFARKKIKGTQKKMERKKARYFVKHRRKSTKLTKETLTSDLSLLKKVKIVFI